MKRSSPETKLLLLATVLIAVGFAIFQTTFSHAESTRIDESSVRPAQDKGTIVARLKDYDPKVEGYGFRNYGGKHDNENDLDAGDLIKLFEPRMSARAAAPSRIVCFTNRLRNGLNSSSRCCRTAIATDWR
jgi:hypothetical protein